MGWGGAGLAGGWAARAASMARLNTLVWSFEPANIVQAGNVITSWTNAGGRGGNLTAVATPDYLPTGGPSGGPCAQLVSDAMEYFTASSLATLTVGEIIIVLRCNADPSIAAHDGLWRIGSAASLSLYPWSSNGNIYDTFGTTVRKDNIVASPSLALWRVYRVVSKANDWRSYLDGALLHSTATNTVGFSSLPMIGRSTDGSNNSFFNGRLESIYLYSTELTVDERSALRTQINNRTGLGLAEI